MYRCGSARAGPPPGQTDTDWGSCREGGGGGGGEAWLE